MIATPTRWGPLRIALLAAFLLALIVSATGVTAQHLFSAPTTTKYYMTVLAPTVGAMMCISRDPLRVILATAIVLGPFATAADLHNVTMTPLGILLVAGALVAIFQDRPAARLTSTSLVLVLVVCLLAPAFMLGDGQRHYAVWIGGTLLAGWLAFIAARDEGGERFILFWIVVAGVVQALIAIYESTRGVQLALHSQSGQAAAATFSFGDNYFRPQGSMADPISLGNMLAFVLPVAVGMGATANDRRDVLGWIACAGTIAFALLLTYSRLSWIGGTVGVLVTILVLPPRPRLAAATAAVAGLLVIVTVGLAVAGPTLSERFSSIADPTARTNRTFQGDRDRENIWHSAWAVFKAHPATGVGFGKLRPALGEHLPGAPVGVHAHSVYLQFLGSAGIAGAAALVLLLGHLGLALWRGLRSDRAVYAAFAGAFVAMLVPWLTDTTARYVQVTAVFAFCFGAMLAARLRPPTMERLPVELPLRDLIEDPPRVTVAA